MLVHRLKHRYQLQKSPNEIFQILGVILLEKTPINQAFLEFQRENEQDENRKQLLLFDI